MVLPKTLGIKAPYIYYYRKLVEIVVLLEYPGNKVALH